MVSTLSLGSPESPRLCFISLAIKGFFPWLRFYESPWWMSAFSALTDVMLITLENNTNLLETLWGSWALGRIRMVFYFTTCCLASTHDSFFFPFCLTRSICSLLPYQPLQIHFPMLYFLYAAPGKTWAHTYWIALDITEVKRKKGHTWVLSLALQFWPASKARHVCPLIIHLGNCKLWANSLRLPAPLAAHLAAAGGCGTLKHLSLEVHNQPE